VLLTFTLMPRLKACQVTFLPFIITCDRSVEMATIWILSTPTPIANHRVRNADCHLRSQHACRPPKSQGDPRCAKLSDEAEKNSCVLPLALWRWRSLDRLLQSRSFDSLTMVYLPRSTVSPRCFFAKFGDRAEKTNNLIGLAQRPA
jgi:hypothetical protein